MSRITIPAGEFKERVQRAAAKMREWGLDALVVNGSEADYANTRYFSNFWPLFERCGVAISACGDCALMVGPESEIFAADFGVIEKIFVLYEYRESADPACAEMKMQKFNDVFKAIKVDEKRSGAGGRAGSGAGSGAGCKLRIGVAAWLDTNLVMMDGLREAYPDAEFVRADRIMTELRQVKSDNEVACLREAARITRLATDEVVKALRPGVTELQMVGVAQRAIYEHGAEYEGLPMFIFSEKGTKHAISRPSYREIKLGDLVQLNLSAKICGYSPSIGVPVSIGKLNAERRELIDFALKAHMWTEERLVTGAPAGEIAKDFIKYYEANGFRDSYLYGPCHGLGLIEVEAPWMETPSTYNLEKNMTFQIDTFAMGSDFGVRWEKPVVIGETKAEMLSDQIGPVQELTF